MEPDTCASTFAGAQRSITTSRLQNKATRATFSFKSDEKAEERDRIRDLAEKNVALQREVLHMKKTRKTIKSQLTESELYMDSFNIKLKDSDNEIAQLRQAFKESEIGTKKAEDNVQSIDAKQRESYALKKAFTRLQRLMKDHERAINNPWLKGDINNDMP